MDSPFGFSVLIGAVLYVAIGLFHILVFGGQGPGATEFANGYGVGYSQIASTETTEVGR